MSLAWPEGQTNITRLWLKSSTSDPLTAQLRLAGLLNAAQLRPGGLGPSAILCVRQLRDPLPGTLRLGRSEAQLPVAWEQAVSAALNHLTSRAARPARGTVPADAEAVLFADQAELLACLARDWLAGELIGHWWWRSLLPRLSALGADQAVKLAWLQAPEHAPAAIEQLAQSSTSVAVAFICAWPVSEVHDLLTRIMQRFGLIELQAALQDQAAQSSGDAPWQRWAPESAAPHLAFTQSALLGISLMLQRAPTEVRSAAFARAVKAALTTPDILKGQPPSTTQSPEPTRDEGPASESIQATPNPVRDLTPPRLSPVTPLTHTETLERRRLPSLKTSFPRKAHPRAGYDLRRSDNVLTKPRSDIFTSPSGEAAKPEISEPFSMELSESPWVIFTAFGGVFYLINLSLYLGYYADFTTPLTPGLSLAIWDFLALVGRELLGESSEADDVWSLLAALAGREVNEPPGRGFEPPDGSAQAAREWVEAQIPFIRARLHSALGLNDDDDVAGLLCRNSAQVEVRPAHLDVFFSLAELPIEIRLSGLDRDPGWVPAAGRYVAFHFD